MWANAQSQPAVSAQSAILYDGASGTVFFEKNADEPRGMASTTKIMTALVALEQYELDREVVIEPAWCGVEGSSMYLKAGETLTVDHLLYGLLLESGNDAATALAGMDPEGQPGFVEKMNAKAQALGLTRTHFDNPSGLDGETHQTTARELAQLTAAALAEPAFAEMVATVQKSIPGRTLINHNRLLKEFGACGVKTGFTKACGRCLVSAKEDKGRLLICVTLHDPNDWDDHKALYRWAFDQMEQQDILGAGDCGQARLVSSEKTAVRLYCNESFSAWMTRQERENLSLILCGPRFCYGSVHAGQQYGSLQVKMGERVLLETPVFFAETSLEQEPSPTVFQRIISFLFRRTTD